MLTKDKYTGILLGGHSRGGMVSLLYTARDNRISKVLGIMPSSDKSMTPAREKWMLVKWCCIAMKLCVHLREFALYFMLHALYAKRGQGYHENF